MDTAKHIDALRSASLEMEDYLRRNGGYSRDCARVNNAIQRGRKTGIAILFDERGEMEVVDLNGGSKHIHVTKEGEHVTVETNFEGRHNPGPSKEHTDNPQRNAIELSSAYEQMGGENWEKAKAQSHERENVTKGHFPSQVHEGARTLAKKQPTGDAARLAKENAAKEKAYRADAIARNERIAAAMKERSTQIHR